MSEAHRKRGTRPPKAVRPWSAAEDALVRSLAPAEVVKNWAVAEGGLLSARAVEGAGSSAETYKWLTFSDLLGQGRVAMYG